ncbi:MAG: hypothetical protein HY852_25440 [Bradyrhizobium sp.]|uniref:hypothetical protein n=1 Tax=Bradyrhizobium sp. TaxID=376 RepID=UPI0025B80009|nr:hypothetical protein [Bradyrhizobium sp.]MBI5265152.1 hypothetical protein [Bradyrhizobium sp.]
MINQMAVRVWDGFLSMLSPGFLIDSLLDWIEKLSGPIEPAQADGMVRNEVHFKGLLD